MSQHHQIGGLSVDCPGLDAGCKYCRMGKVPVDRPDPPPASEPLPGAAAGAPGKARPPENPDVYPTPERVENRHGEFQGFAYVDGGLKLRDLLACHAVAALAARWGTETNSLGWHAKLAATAYQVADAMLVARQQPTASPPPATSSSPAPAAERRAS